MGCKESNQTNKINISNTKRIEKLFCDITKYSHVHYVSTILQFPPSLCWHSRVQGLLHETLLDLLLPKDLTAKTGHTAQMTVHKISDSVPAGNALASSKERIVHKQDSHRLEKYLKIQDCLEKYWKNTHRP